MFSRKNNRPADQAPAPRPDDSARRDPALAAVAFRDQLIRLIDEAQAHVSFHVLVDTIEGQLTRVRMNNAANRPW
jgi:hypothetical protein